MIFGNVYMCAMLAYVLYVMFLVCVCGKFVCGIFLWGTLGDVHGANEVWSLLSVLLFFNFGS